jgi:hypothetical protein
MRHNSEHLIEISLMRQTNGRVVLASDDPRLTLSAMRLSQSRLASRGGSVLSMSVLRQRVTPAWSHPLIMGS